jgi:hypothetical protein
LIVSADASAATVILNCFVAVCAGVLASVTWTVKVDVPAGPVGVPVMEPVLALNVKPAGSEPELSAQE